MKQLICLSYAPWSARPNRTEQLLTRLEDVQILFFEPPEPRGTPAREALRVRPNILVYTLPAPLWGAGSALLQQRRHRRIEAMIRRTAQQHHFRAPAAWYTSPEYSFLLERLGECCVIYDCHREWDRLPLDWESDLALAADVVFAASPILRQRLAPCSDNIALLPNGVNPRMFSRAGLTVPESVAALPAPVLCRVGDLPADMELEPLLYAARRRPEWNFLLIGRCAARARAALSGYPNIHLAGAVPAVELPDYLSGCQALFELLRTSSRGSDIIPARLYEYLATGKPIVSMIEPEQVEPFPDMVYTAYDAAGFVRRCQAALEEHPGPIQARRLAFAAQSSWSQRASEVSRILSAAGLL